MNLDWTPEQQALIAEASRFAHDRLLPRDRPTAFDEAGWRACAEHGVLALPLPAAWGGRGEGALTTVAVFEALGRGGADRGLLFALGAHLFGCALPISRYGSAHQQARWGTGLADGSAIGALAITDPAGGSDLTLMGARALGGTEGYVLSGEKTLVTNGPRADVFLVIAATAPDRGPLGLSAFLVPRETPGLSVEPLGAPGLPGAPMATIMFKECGLPPAALLGPVGAGMKVMSSSLRWERSCLLAGFLGAAERDLQSCLAHVRARRDRRGPLLKHEAVAHRLARMKLRLEAARWLVYRAAWNIDEGRGVLLAPALAKLAASECLVDNALDALRISAGPGWLDEAGLASALRDVVGTMSASGTTDVQLSVIAASLGVEDP
jgi:alkylation response protein AidB-like acyl-CoA dehydrogenase